MTNCAETAPSPRADRVSSPRPAGAPSGVTGAIEEQVAALGAASSDEERERLLPPLASAVQEASSSLQLLRFCEAARETDVLELVCGCVRHADALIHQSALVLLCCAATEDIDPLADLSRLRIKACGGFESICPHLFSDVALTVALSCGCIQNMLADADNSISLQMCGGVARLRELIACESPAISAAAHACLRNLFLFEQAQPPQRRSSSDDASEAVALTTRASDIPSELAPRQWHRAATLLQFRYLRHLDARRRGAATTALCRVIVDEAMRRAVLASIAAVERVRAMCRAVVDGSIRRAVRASLPSSEAPAASSGAEGAGEGAEAEKRGGIETALQAH